MSMDLKTNIKTSYKKFVPEKVCNDIVNAETDYCNLETLIMHEISFASCSLRQFWIFQVIYKWEKTILSLKTALRKVW